MHVRGIRCIERPCPVPPKCNPHLALLQHPQTSAPAPALPPPLPSCSPTCGVNVAVHLLAVHALVVAAVLGHAGVVARRSSEDACSTCPGGRLSAADRLR